MQRLKQYLKKKRNIIRKNLKKFIIKEYNAFIIAFKGMDQPVPFKNYIYSTLKSIFYKKN